jgi:AcrR family transcriptional regulator
LPKKVDHDQRRKDLARAAFTVITTQGLGNATIREVARVAGCSTGALVHYIDSKDKLLLEAASYGVSQTDERLEVAERDHKGLAALKQVLIELLPLDQRRANGWKIWFSFWERSIVSAEIRTLIHNAYAESHRRYRRLLKNAQEAGDISQDIDVARAAGSLISFLDGIGVQVLISGQKVSPKRQIQYVDDWIDGVLKPIKKAD